MSERRLEGVARKPSQCRCRADVEREEVSVEIGA